MIGFFWRISSILRTQQRCFHIDNVIVGVVKENAGLIDAARVYPKIGGADGILSTLGMVLARAPSPAPAVRSNHDMTAET